MRLGFVFTNYNNSKFTLNLIQSIITSDCLDYKIIIVDNNSNSEDKAKLSQIEKQHSQVFVIYSKINVGYFKGLNLGIQYLRKNYFDTQLIIVGNNDLLFPSNFNRCLKLQSSLFDQYPVISPSIITIDGFHQNPHVIFKISFIREIIYDLYHLNYYFAKFILFVSNLFPAYSKRGDEDQFNIAREIVQGYGACYILTPKFFQLYDELYAPSFLMYEEYFLSYQLNINNYKIFYEPSIQITHLMHASTNVLPRKLKWIYSKGSHIIHRKTNKIFSI